ncbi:type II toxin-antitoxin system HicB family antitoxin [Longispora albida]|uniref:type II toxin-antitoxin system HicB family antitoxin n=1 Tax=Longispora albida TaxID=203523 RepID=UPI00036A138C|nr:type II toxin-antitoxin system HicB family antitoxin [Longispora albida]
MTEYTILIERADDGGYGAWCPDLPGCVALGDTYDECVDEMRSAMTFHLEVMREHNEPIPVSTTVGAALIVI